MTLLRFVCIVLFITIHHVIHGNDCDCVSRENVRVGAIIPHENANYHPAFWEQIQLGMKQAARDLKIQLEIRVLNIFDSLNGVAAAQTEAVNEILSINVDGLIISTSVALTEVKNQLQASEMKNIPVIGIASDRSHMAELNNSNTLLTLFGSEAIKAGSLAAQNLASRISGVQNKTLICINHRQNQQLFNLHCDGFKDYCQNANISSQVLSYLDSSSLRESNIKELLDNLDTLAGVFTLSPDIASFIDTIVPQGRDILLSTAGFNDDVWRLLEKKRLSFIVSQQPYYQGYMSLVYMSTFLTRYQVPSMPFTTTGPVVVDTIKNVTKLGTQRFGTISHRNSATSSFWSTVWKGVNQAVSELDIENDLAFLEDTTFSADPFESIKKWLDIFEKNDTIDAIHLTLAYDLHNTSEYIKAHAKKPIISYNSGYEISALHDVVTHVGQDEYLAGYLSGKRFYNYGVRKALCVTKPDTPIIRCDGFRDGFMSLGGTVEDKNNGRYTTVTVAQIEDSAIQIADALSRFSINGIMASSNSIVGAIELGMERTNLTHDDIFLGTYDLNEESIGRLNRGELKFTVLQQSFLQGYLPQYMLSVLQRVGNYTLDKITLSGPSFATKDNVDSRRCENTDVCVGSNSEQSFLLVSDKEQIVAQGVVLANITRFTLLDDIKRSGKVVVTDACEDIPYSKGQIVVSRFEGCFISTKAAHAQGSGASALIIVMPELFEPVVFVNKSDKGSLDIPVLVVGGNFRGQMLSLNGAQLSILQNLELQKLNNAARLVFVALAGFAICLCCLLGVYVVLQRKLPQIRASSYIFLLLLILGAVLCFASIFAWAYPTGDPTTVSCILRPWLINIGFTLLYGSLFLKTFRIWRIFRNKVLSAEVILDSHLIFYLSAFLAVDIIILLVLSIMHTPKPKTYELYVQCSIEFPYFLAMVLTKGLLLLFGVFLAVSTRKVISAYNESRFIGFSIYSVSFIAAVIVPIYAVNLSLTSQYVLYSAGVIVSTVVTMVLIFAPKIRSIERGDKLTRQDVARQMMERAQRKDPSTLNSTTTSTF